MSTMGYDDSTVTLLTISTDNRYRGNRVYHRELTIGHHVLIAGDFYIVVDRIGKKVYIDKLPEEELPF